MKFQADKAYRQYTKPDFPGADIIMKAIEAGASRHLTGILPDGQRPVRDGAILELDGQTVGHISSGGFSPSLNRPAALGFVDSTISKDGQQLVAVAGGRSIEVTTAALPLVPHRYARPPK